jgi:hypothetical protein
MVKYNEGKMKQIFGENYPYKDFIDELRTKVPDGSDTNDQEIS